MVLDYFNSMSIQNAIHIPLVQLEYKTDPPPPQGYSEPHFQECSVWSPGWSSLWYMEPRPCRRFIKHLSLQKYLNKQWTRNLHCFDLCCETTCKNTFKITSTRDPTHGFFNFLETSVLNDTPLALAQNLDPSGPKRHPRLDPNSA